LSDLPPLTPGQNNPISKYKAPSTKYLDRFEIRNGADFVTQHIARPHNERDLEIYAIAIELWLNERKRLQYDELPKRLKTHKNDGAFLDRF